MPTPRCCGRLRPQRQQRYWQRRWMWQTPGWRLLSCAPPASSPEGPESRARPPRAYPEAAALDRLPQAVRVPLCYFPFSVKTGASRIRSAWQPSHPSHHRSRRRLPEAREHRPSCPGYRGENPWRVLLQRQFRAASQAGQSTRAPH